MRFVAIITVGDCVAARVSVDDRTPGDGAAVAADARDTLIRDANRHRHSGLTDAVLEKFADVYAQIAMEQTLSREGRVATCIAKGGGPMVVRDGDVSLLVAATDAIMRVEAIDDAKLAETDAFLDRVFQRA